MDSYKLIVSRCNPVTISATSSCASPTLQVITFRSQFVDSQRFSDSNSSPSIHTRGSRALTFLFRLLDSKGAESRAFANLPSCDFRPLASSSSSLTRLGESFYRLRASSTISTECTTCRFISACFSVASSALFTTSTIRQKDSANCATALLARFLVLLASSLLHF